MSTREDERDRRARDSGTDAEGQGGAASPGDDESPVRTLAKVAAVGALAGAAVAAARAAATHGGDSDGNQERSEASAAEEEEAPEADQEPEQTVAQVPTGSEADRREQREADEASAEPNEDEPDHKSQDTSPASDDGKLARILGGAAQQLSHLAGHPAEGVRAFKRSEDGWHVEVELVELARIPSTTDVLGLYEAEVDEDGQIREYRRTHRYIRSQANDSTES